MEKFTKPDFKAVVIIFLILIAISIPNFALSIVRARDQVRRDDLGAFENGLGDYFIDFGVFPLSTPDGKIIACKRPDEVPTPNPKGGYMVNLIPCEFGKDKLVDFTPQSNKIYMPTIPQDPNKNKGASYAYFSNGARYQIYVSQEGKDQIEYNKKIIARNLKCGNKICNTGRSYKVPIDMSINDYETLLDLQNNAKK